MNPLSEAAVPSYDLAQSILGVDFITPEEATKIYPNVVYSDEQIAALAGSLPSEEVLRWCNSNDCAVMPAPPTTMSILDMRDMHIDLRDDRQIAQFKESYSEKEAWSFNQKFIREDRTSPGWLMIKKTPVTDSTAKTWGEQNKILSELEVVPNAADMYWFITTYYRVRGVRLFEKTYARTSSLNSEGNAIHVGTFDIMGVFFYSDDSSVYCLGLAAARKPDLAPQTS